MRFSELFNLVLTSLGLNLSKPQSAWSFLSIGDQGRCQNVHAWLQLPNTTLIVSQRHDEADVLQLTGQADSCGASSTTITAPLCRLAFSVKTSPSSEIFVDAWLPDEWNGRFLGTGTGGISGCVDYGTMQMGAQLGFASLGTNAGHNGSAGYDFFLNKPEVIEDFGGRSIHVEAVVGKHLVREYYGKDLKGSYFAGCSSGGRQGFKSALDFPGDFDGILAGAPGVNWIRTISSKGILAQRVAAEEHDSPMRLRDDQWTAVVEEQVVQCDGLDGVLDGIIDDPTKCTFDPETISCGAGRLNDSVCLSPQQVLSVRQAYEPIADSDGNIVYPSFGFGAATDAFSGYPESYTILSNFFKGTIYNSSTWNASTFGTKDMDFAVKVDPGGVNTARTDLSNFRARGGKLLVYHGRSDEAVTSVTSRNFFQSVQANLNLTLAETHDFYRIFYIPGMHHCKAGPGAWNIGQAGIGAVESNMSNPRHNALLALVEWTENGTAPTSIIGTKYNNDNMTQPILSQRVHCVYPNTSIYTGRPGHYKVASSWTCKSYLDTVPGYQVQYASVYR